MLESQVYKRVVSTWDIANLESSLSKMAQVSLLRANET